MIATEGRWCYRGPYGGRRYNWSQCRFCGRATEPGRDCPRVECLLCGTPQCQSGRSHCLVCHAGWLPGVWRPGGDGCQRARCEGKAVATIRKRAVGVDHAVSLQEKVVEAVAHRDSGKGWEQWRFVT